MSIHGGSLKITLYRPFNRVEVFYFTKNFVYPSHFLEISHNCYKAFYRCGTDITILHEESLKITRTVPLSCKNPYFRQFLPEGETA